MIPRYGYHRPETLEEAMALVLERPGACYVAGGTDLMVRLRAGTVRPGALVSLRRCPGLAGIEAAPGGALCIGALTPVADVAGSPEVRARWPALAGAASRLGSAQVRNAATVGGNLCNASPCADLAPPLLVLEARVELRGPEGVRTLPLEDFFLTPGQTRSARGEVLTAVLVDEPPPGARMAFVKQTRVALDLALASVAVLVDPEGGVRLAAGSVAPRPVRLRRAEALLAGRAPGPETLDEALRAAREEVAPISDLRASAGYRRHLVGVLAGRTLRRLWGGGAS